MVIIWGVIASVIIVVSVFFRKKIINQPLEIQKWAICQPVSVVDKVNFGFSKFSIWLCLGILFFAILLCVPQLIMKVLSSWVGDFFCYPYFCLVYGTK